MPDRLRKFAAPAKTLAGGGGGCDGVWPYPSGSLAFFMALVHTAPLPASQYHCEGGGSGFLIISPLAV